MTPATYEQTRPRPNRERNLMRYPLHSTVTEVIGLDQSGFKVVVLYECHDGDRRRSCSQFRSEQDAHAYARESLKFRKGPK